MNQPNMMMGMGQNIPPMQNQQIPGNAPPSMQSQQVPSKPPLKVNLTNKEKGYYSNLLFQADPKGTNKVGGQEGVTFFKRSGVKIDVLKNIWKTAARSSPEYLTRDEFYLALRLIAYAQNGVEPTEKSIQFDIPVDLPNFDVAPLAITAPQQQSRPQPEIRQEEIAKNLPDLDSLNIHDMDNVQSLIPSINQREQQKQMQQMQEQVLKQQQMMQRQMMDQTKHMMEQAKHSPWFIQQGEQEKYCKIFDHFDEEKKGTLDDQHMNGVFKQTQLPKEILDKAWGLVNPRNLKQFDKKMFCIAMHLLYKGKTGVELPNQIPKEMWISVDPQGFFQQQQQMMMQQQQNPQQMQQMPIQQNHQQPIRQQAPQSPQKPQQQQQQVHMASPQQVGSSQNVNHSLDLLDLGSSPKIQQQKFQPQQPAFQNQSSAKRNQSSNGRPYEHLQTNQPVQAFELANQNINTQMKQGQQKDELQNLKQQNFNLQNQINQRQDDIRFLQSVYNQDNTQYTELITDNGKLKQELEELDKEFNMIKAKIAEQRRQLDADRIKNQQLRTNVETKLLAIKNENENYEEVIGERMHLYEQALAHQTQYERTLSIKNEAANQSQTQQNYSNYDYYQQPQRQETTGSNTQRKDSYGANNDYNYNYNYDQSYGNYNQQQQQQWYGGQQTYEYGTNYQKEPSLSKNPSQTINYNQQNQSYSNNDYSQKPQHDSHMGAGNQFGTNTQQWVSFDDPVAEQKNGNPGGFDFGEKFDFGNDNTGGGFDFSQGKEARFEFS